MPWDVDLSIVCELQEAIEWYGIYESKWNINRIWENLSSDAILDYKNNRRIQKLYVLLEPGNTSDLGCCCFYYTADDAINFDSHLIYSGIFKVLAIKNEFFSSKIGNCIFRVFSYYDKVFM